jgi:hypothetical protein
MPALSVAAMVISCRNLAVEAAARARSTGRRVRRNERRDDTNDMMMLPSSGADSFHVEGADDGRDNSRIR